MRITTCRKLLLASAGMALMGAPAFAQTSDNAPEEDEIIVTGTSVDRTGFNTPTTLSVVKESDFKNFLVGSGSQADLLQQIPGVSAEAGGGENAANFRVRGLPSGGPGFPFSRIAYDGITVQSAAGLTSSAADFLLKPDLGIGRVEYVKGSVSNLLGIGAPASLINYISKEGTDENHGTVQMAVGENGRYRGDFALQGPVADNTYYAVSGFYRYDEGPVKSGLPSKGYSLRGNLKREFDDGSGFVKVSGNYMNDSVQFFLPVFLDGQTRERVTGNDGSTVYTLNSEEIAGVVVPSPEGTTRFDADDGFYTKGGFIAAELDKEFGDGWGVNSKAKFATYDSASNFTFGGEGVYGANIPVSQDTFIANAINAGVVLPAGFVPTFTYAETGQALAPDDLVIGEVFLDRERPIDDATFEFNLTKTVQTDSVEHNFTAGTWFSRAEQDNNQRNVIFLGDFNNSPRLVDVTFVDPMDAANNQELVPGGIVRAPAGYSNERLSATRKAIYFADQMEADRWALDVAVRWEEQSIENRREQGSISFPSTIASNPAVGSVAATGVFGSGNIINGDAATDNLSFAVAGLYRATDNVNVFANYTKGYFFPAPRGTGGQIATTGDIQVYRGEPLTQAEIGAKFDMGNLSGSLTGFYTTLNDRTNVSFVGGGDLTPVLTLTDSRSYGIEAVGDFSVNDWLSLNGAVVWQDTEITDSDNAGIVGNEFNQIPNIIVDLGVNVDHDNGFDAGVYWNYRGDNFADGGNNVELDGFSTVRLTAGYSFDLGDGGDRLRAGINVFNLTDSTGIQEGNTRGGIIQQNNPAASFFFGRPILPRRVNFSLTYDF